MTAQETETYCLKVVNPFYSFSESLDKIDTALNLGGVGLSWNGLENGKVDFRYHPNQCDQADPKLGDVEVRFIVEPAGCGGPGIASCVSNYFDPAFNILTGHDEYKSSEITMHELHMSTEICDGTFPSCWKHVINQEVGHVLGLDDGVQGGPDPCPVSIMHDTTDGCPTDFLSPTALDRMSVEEMIPGTGGAENIGSGCDRGFLSLFC